MSTTVTVKQGKLKGIVCQSVLGSCYISFKGIPFAAPPLGPLRFKDPEPPASWIGVRDASSIDVNCCIQLNQYPPYDVIGDEDCLYLNVYTTSLTEKKPVMVYIHGGGFVSGSGIDKLIRPDYLINKDIVLVTINYRVGVLGFLNLDDEVASGNQGLKDQVAALKWVQENISNFGGDAKNVTIFGPSAGGASVHYLTKSPMAKGLFHKAICQSGTATCVWATGKGKKERGFALASLLGKNSKDPKEVVEFLQTIPASRLVQDQTKILTPLEIALLTLPVGPTVDPKSKNPFLPRPTNELSNDIDIPIMLGYTNNEFIMFMKDCSDENLKKLDQLLGDFVKIFATLGNIEPSQIDNLEKDIRKFYFGNKPISKELIPAWISFMSEIFFSHPINMVADDRRKKKCAPTYLYEFSYIGDEVTITQTLQEYLTKLDNFEYCPKGASHVDEQSYLFYLPRCKTTNPAAPALGTKDRAMIERITYLFTNFARTGDPTSKLNEYVDSTWKPVSKDSFTYLDIKDMKNRPLKDNVAEICKKYG